MSEQVLVLMSTYNGERYLREQIESIVAQEGVHVHLLARDDGSTDNTIQLLKAYQAKGALTFYQGENLGPQRSFMRLLRDAPRADYYAFADQDDVWLKDKLSQAVSDLQAHSAALYFSQTQLTDERLRPIKNVTLHPLLTFGEALIYKFASGCTMVFNHALRELATKTPPKDMPPHDVWLYLVATAYGMPIVFDPTPRILYRQHAHNAIGLNHGFLHEWKLRFRHLFLTPGIRSGLARQLRQSHGDTLPKENMRLLDLFIEGKHSVAKRLAILRGKDFRCADKETQILFWISLSLNKY